MNQQSTAHYKENLLTMQYKSVIPCQLRLCMWIFIREYLRFASIFNWCIVLDMLFFCSSCKVYKECVTFAIQPKSNWKSGKKRRCTESNEIIHSQRRYKCCLPYVLCHLQCRKHKKEKKPLPRRTIDIHHSKGSITAYYC